MNQFKLKGLKKEFLTPRTNDDVHGSIKLCPISKELMSTPQMQRLKQLKQLGVSDITYVCTTHTRFEHSLGVMHLSEQLLHGIRERQPQLNISEKDIVCVKIAGLLHDVGHGPYSHVYDGTFRKQLKMAEKKGAWLGQTFDTSMYKDLPVAMEGWAHEDASLMMIDGILKSLGLEIDESNLDEPLKQIGSGIDKNCFGVWDRSSEPSFTLDDDDAGYDSDMDGNATTDLVPLASELVLTSRDWIFIKECIVGGPLPPNGISIQNFKKSKQRAQLVGRPNPHKEFLYDIVSNSRSGLDTDKMDYLARDTLRAFGANCIADLLDKMIEKAFVAWGECPIDGKKHLMICYPEHLAQNFMSFFEQRYKEHQRLYTHSKTQRGNLMICDALLLAEPHFRISTMNDGEDISSPPPDATGLKLPISRAMTDAATYLELTDSVLDKIMNTDCIELRPARILIKRFRAHKIYKRVGTQIIGNENWQDKLWCMAEEEIVGEILGQSDICTSGNDGNALLVEDDLIVDKRQIHHGMKEKNPVNFMRFLPKELRRQLLNSPENLPTAIQIPDSSYRKPDFFLQKAVRIFTRTLDDDKREHLVKCYEKFICKLQNGEVSNGDDPFSVQIEEPIETFMPQTPTKKSYVDIPSITQSPGTYYESSPPRSNKRQVGLYAAAMKRSRHN